MYPDSSIFNGTGQNPYFNNDDVISKAYYLYNDDLTPPTPANHHYFHGDIILQPRLKEHFSIIFISATRKCLLCNNQCQCSNIISYRTLLKFLDMENSRTTLYKNKYIITILREPNHIENILESPNALFMQILSIMKLKNIYSFKFGIHRGVVEDFTPTADLLKQNFLIFLMNPLFQEPTQFYTIDSSTIHHNSAKTCLKNIGLKNSDIGIPSEAIHPVDIGFFPDNPSEPNLDFQQMLQSSDPTMEDFLKLVFKCYDNVSSQAATDIGKFYNPRYTLDLELKIPNESLLPKHLPFISNKNSRQAADILIQVLIDSNILVESNNTKFASRMMIVKKASSLKDRQQISDRLKTDLNITLDPNQPGDVYLISPDLLTSKELSKLFRLVLDARDINSLTVESTPISQNPDSVFLDLQSTLHNSKSTTSLIIHTQESLRPPPPYMVPDQSIPPTPKDFEDLQNYLNSEVFKNPSDDKLYISSLDLKQAHQTVILSERASYYLNIVSPNLKTYRFLRAPFGLQSINTIFNLNLIHLLHDLISKNLVYLYADDIILVCRSRKTHAILISEICRRFSENGIKISINKCCFFAKKFTYLGHEFSQDGIRITDERVKALLDFQQPKTVKAVQRFCGMLVYLNRFIPNLAINLAPFSDLIRKNSTFAWSQIHEDSFNLVKQQLRDRVPLHYIPERAALHLFADASKLGGGAALFCSDNPEQLNSDNSDLEDMTNLKPIMFLSRKFSEIQKTSYSSLENELSNLLDSLHKLQYFVQSGRKIFVHSDCKAIFWLLRSNKTSSNSKIARMNYKLKQFPVSYVINYIKPTNPGLFIADVLSRQHEVVEEPNLNSIQDLRKIDKEQINHDLQGIFTYDQLCEILEGHPEIINTPYPAENQPPSSTQTRNLHNIQLYQPDLELHSIAENQRRDPEIAKLVEFFTLNPAKQNSLYMGRFVFKKEIIFRVKDVDKPPTADNLQIFMPEVLLPLLVGTFHCNLAHSGYEKILMVLKESYYHKDLAAVTKQLLEGCLYCELNRPSSYRRAKITGFHVAEKPNDIVAIDFMTLQTFKGFSKVLIFADHFSSHIVAYPLTSEKVTEVIKCLKQYISHYGPMLSIKSDNSLSLLRNITVRAFLASFNISRLMLSLAYSPTHNSRAELSVKNFRKVLKICMFRENSQDWVSQVPLCNVICNIIPRKYSPDLITTPFEIFFGRQAPPISEIPKLLLATEDKTQPQPLEFYENLISKVKQAHDSNLQQYTEKFNEKAALLPIQPGNLVLLKNLQPPGANELNSKQREMFYQRPFLLKEIRGHLAVLEDLTNSKIILSHTKFIKRLDERTELFNNLPSYLQKQMGLPLSLNLDKSRHDILANLRRSGYNLQQAAKEDDLIAMNSGFRKTSQGSIVENLPKPAAPRIPHADPVAETLPSLHAQSNISDEFWTSDRAIEPSDHPKTSNAPASQNVALSNSSNSIETPPSNISNMKTASEVGKRITRAFARLRK